MTAHPVGRMTIGQFVKYREQLTKDVQAGKKNPQEAYYELAERALRAIEVAPPRFTRNNLQHIAYLTMTFRQWARYEETPRWIAAHHRRPETTQGVDTLAGYGSARQSACDAVLAVMAWYSEQITVERRRGSPDDTKIGELMTARFETRNDLDRARAASPEEAEQIAGKYAAHLLDLTSKEDQS